MGKLRALIHRKNPNFCKDCGELLYPNEIKYYEYRCEKCERKLLKKIRKK